LGRGGERKKYIYLYIYIYVYIYIYIYIRDRDRPCIYRAFVFDGGCIAAMKPDFEGKSE